VPAPERLVEHLKQENYHPRSSKHGEALCRFILDDLLAYCPAIAADAARGWLVYCHNRQIVVGNSNWNIDLVLGPPAASHVGRPETAKIQNSPPAAIRVAIEAKSIMTEHGKARRNRLRDLDSFHQYVHRYDSAALAAAVTVINVAPRFRSPLRPDISNHRNIHQLAEKTVALFKTLPETAGRARHGLDANAVILITHDNIDAGQTDIVRTSPAPQIGDPMNYESFIRRLCDRYTSRWK
jgi:hypothetical protein